MPQNYLTAPLAAARLDKLRNRARQHARREHQAQVRFEATHGTNRDLAALEAIEAASEAAFIEYHEARQAANLSE